MRIGIMQGRLLPPEEGRFQAFPRKRWREEFPLAALAGMDSIEWIYDLHGADVNPLETAHGRSELKELSDRYGVPVVSVCADWFMDRRLLRVDEHVMENRIQVLFRLIDASGHLGIERIILPFVDNSSIRTGDEFEMVITLLGRVLPQCERASVEIHLETSLAPARFAALLDRLPNPFLKVNYDSGNSASLGYSVHEEFAAYGSRVGSIHVKDRLTGGGTVPLGTGSTDFAALKEELVRRRFAEDFVLQAARGKPGDEVTWTRNNLSFALAHVIPPEERS